MQFFNARIKEIAASTALMVPLDKEYFPSTILIPQKIDRETAAIAKLPDSQVNQLFKLLMAFFQTNVNANQIGISPVKVQALIDAISKLSSLVGEAKSLRHAAAEFQATQKIETAYHVVVQLQALFERILERPESCSEVPVVFPRGEMNMGIILQNNSWDFSTMDLQHECTVFVKPNLKLLCCMQRAASSLDTYGDLIENVINQLGPLTYEEFLESFNRLRESDNVFSAFPRSLRHKLVFQRVNFNESEGCILLQRAKINSLVAHCGTNEKLACLFQPHDEDSTDARFLKTLLAFTADSFTLEEELAWSFSRAKIQTLAQQLQELPQKEPRKLRDTAQRLLSRLEEWLAKPDLNLIEQIAAEIQQAYAAVAQAKHCPLDPTGVLYLPGAEFSPDVLRANIACEYPPELVQKPGTLFVRPTIEMLLLAAKPQRFNVFCEEFIDLLEAQPQLNLSQMLMDVQNLRESGRLSFANPALLRSLLFREQAIKLPQRVVPWISHQKSIPKAFQRGSEDIGAVILFKTLWKFFSIAVDGEGFLNIDLPLLRDEVIEVLKVNSISVVILQEYLDTPSEEHAILAVDYLCGAYMATLDSQETHKKAHIVLPRGEISAGVVEDILELRYDNLSLHHPETLILAPTNKLLAMLALFAEGQTALVSAIERDVIKASPASPEDVYQMAQDRKTAFEDPDFYARFLFLEATDYCNCLYKLERALIAPRVAECPLFKPHEDESEALQTFKQVAAFLSECTEPKEASVGLRITTEKVQQLYDNAVSLEFAQSYLHDPTLETALNFIESLIAQFHSVAPTLEDSKHFAYFPHGEIAPEAIKNCVEQNFTPFVLADNTLTFRMDMWLAVCLVNNDVDGLSLLLMDRQPIALHDLVSTLQKSRAALSKYPTSLLEQLFLREKAGRFQVRLPETLSLPRPDIIPDAVRHKYPALCKLFQAMDGEWLFLDGPKNVLDAVQECDIISRHAETDVARNEILPELIYCFTGLSETQARANASGEHIPITPDTEFINPTLAFVLECCTAASLTKLQELYPGCKKLSREELRASVIALTTYSGLNPDLVRMAAITEPREAEFAIIVPQIAHKELLPRGGAERFRALGLLQGDAAVLLGFLCASCAESDGVLRLFVRPEAVQELDILTLRPLSAAFLRARDAQAALVLCSAVLELFEELMDSAETVCYAGFCAFNREEALKNMRGDFGISLAERESAKFYALNARDFLQLWKFAEGTEAEDMDTSHLTHPLTHAELTQILLEEMVTKETFQINTFNALFLFAEENGETLLRAGKELAQLIPRACPALEIQLNDAPEERRLKQLTLALDTARRGDWLHIERAASQLGYGAIGEGLGKLQMLYAIYLRVLGEVEDILGRNPLGTTVFAFPRGEISKEIVLRNLNNNYAELSLTSADTFCFRAPVRLLLTMALAAEEFDARSEQIIQQISELDALDAADLRETADFLSMAGCVTPLVACMTSRAPQLYRRIAEVEAALHSLYTRERGDFWALRAVSLTDRHVKTGLSASTLREISTQNIAFDRALEFHSEEDFSVPEEALEELTPLYFFYSQADNLLEFLRQQPWKPMYRASRRVVLLAGKLLRYQSLEAFEELRLAVKEECPMEEFRVLLQDRSGILGTSHLCYATEGSMAVVQIKKKDVFAIKTESVGVLRLQENFCEECASIALWELLQTPEEDWPSTAETQVSKSVCLRRETREQEE